MAAPHTTEPDDLEHEEEAPTTGRKESSKALAAFERYWAMGPTRSLRKLADEGYGAITNVERWSATFEWGKRIREREQEEIAAKRAAALKEAAALARRRLRNAQVLQDAGLTVLSKADLTNLTAAEARKLIADAQRMIAEGIKAERVELGEVTATFSFKPPKPIREMNDEELAAYIASLEEQS